MKAKEKAQPQARPQKKKRKATLSKQVYAAELPLRRRAAKLQAVANRNEALNALKADFLRSELARLQGIMNVAPANQQTAAAVDQLRNHLRELAQ